MTPGLGDLVAAAASAVGITPERADAAAKAVGLDGCNCDARRKLLNRLGQRYFGIGGASTKPGLTPIADVAEPTNEPEA